MYIKLKNRSQKAREGEGGGREKGWRKPNRKIAKWITVPNRLLLSQTQAKIFDNK